MLIKTIYKTGQPAFDTADTFVRFARIILLNYNANMINGFEIQYSPEEDWSPINIYDLLEETIPEDQHYHRWGIHIYKFDHFYIIANPDRDIVEVFHD